MAGKAILRVELVIFYHDLIARYLRHNRGCSYGKTTGIAFYDRHVRTISGKPYNTIDQNIIRLYREIIQGHLHGLFGSLVYIYLVDIFFADYTQAGHAVLDNFQVGRVTLSFRQFL